MKNAISIQEALAEMERISMKGDTFTLAFVRSNGPKKGSIKMIARARRGAPKPKGSSQQPKAKGQKPATGPVHKIHLTIPLTDVEKMQYITPLISHIILFNSQKVMH